MKILTCVGTRPNFIKVTRLRSSFAAKGIHDFKLLHTGQHFDKNMSQIFFDDLKLQEPDYYLHASGKSQVELIADIMVKAEKVMLEYQADWVLTPGDVNSTLACAIVANRLGFKLAHIESGLRSFDNTMPEEINRLMVDSISDLLLVSENSGLENLQQEGKDAKKIVHVGNTMIDSLVKFTEQIDGMKTLETLGISAKKYGLITLHRPSNVDSKERLDKIMTLLNKIAVDIPLLFPIHPRTRKKIDLSKLHDNIKVCDPMGYLDFLKVVKNAKFVFTDSGGIQEETTFLQIPCLTLRPNTERPSTIIEGTNELVDLRDDIEGKVLQILRGDWKKGQIPKYWDGKASERIVAAILNYKN